MRFIVDAQLPARLAQQLVAAGHDAIHTSDMPNGNRTTDVQIATVAETEDRVVVTKDRDFRDSHLRRMACDAAATVFALRRSRRMSG